MDEMVVNIQIATGIGLLGIWVGWRGGMLRLRGFYDLPTATRYLAFGMGIGALMGWLLDLFMTLDAITLLTEAGGYPIDIMLFRAFVLSSFLTTGLLVLLTRKRVKLMHSAATSGWALGLGIGAMLVAREGYRVLELYGFGLDSLYRLIPMGLLLPWMMAIMFAWQGFNTYNSNRWTSTLKATMAHTIMFNVLIFGLFWPLAYILYLPVIGMGQRLANDKWLPSSLSRRSQQRWRRVVSQSKRREELASQRKERFRHNQDSIEEE